MAFITLQKDPERVTYGSLGQRPRIAESILQIPEVMDIISAPYLNEGW
jgi:hypothetical protein